MVVIGITGGIAGGKSYVAGRFERLGAVVLDADRIGHEVLRDPDVEHALCQRWGESVRGADGHIDRRAVAGRVFAAGPAGLRELAFLEQVTHPRITKRVAMELERLRSRPEALAVVLDAALLFEADWDEYCDVTLFVDAPIDVRVARARRRGWSEHDFETRSGAQSPPNEKRRLADMVIDNSGPPENTGRQIDKLWQSLIFP